MAGAEPFVESLAGEDTCVALGLGLLERLGVGSSGDAPS